jgi:hypothetical protein
MTTILYFATRGDVRLILADLRTPLAFSPFGRQSTPKAKIFHSPEEIPNLGTATADSASASSMYLAYPASSALVARRIDTPGAQKHGAFAFDQLDNPDTVTFAPGGLWKNIAIISGSVGTASNSPVARQIFNDFRRSIRSNFERIKSFYVGCEAVEFWRKGLRLTTSLKSPQEYDLSETEEEQRVRMKKRN